MRSARCRACGLAVAAVLVFPTGGAPSLMPVRAATAPCVASNISGGDTFSAAIANGQLFTWGRNVEGELGLGFTSTQVLSPTAVSSNPFLTTATGVWAGFTTTFAVDPSGQLWAWGDDGNGQAGIGASTSSPVPVFGPTSVVSVAPSFSHTIAVTSDGSVWGWGQSSGLGAGDTFFTQTVPAVLATPAHVVKVAAGFRYSLVLTSDGSLWGAGSALPIGIGGTAFVPIFTQIPTLAGVVNVATSDAISQQFTLVTDSAGHVFAFGSNSVGQFGTGTPGVPLSSTTPVQVPGLDSVTQVAAGGGQALALKSDGTLWAWGADGSGQLGIGSVNGAGVATPTQVLFPAGTVIVRVAAGQLHSMAVDSQGNVWVWGDDQLGALGTGVANQNQPTPVKITLAASCPGPPPPPTLPTVTSVSPSFGPAGGGTLVTITGTGFTNADSVQFGSGQPLLQPCASTSAPACFTVVDDAHITVTSPSMVVGAFDVFVGNANGSSAASPGDSFIFEGWAAPTPADGSTVTVPMTNPPQTTTIVARLVEEGTPSIVLSGNPAWLSCAQSNPAANLAELDCVANPTDATGGLVTFADAVNPTRVPVRTVNITVQHLGYRPNPDGYQFTNVGDPSPSLADIQLDYPGSNIVFGDPVQTAAFYKLFQNFTSGGLCYGFATSSLYFFQDSAGSPLSPYSIPGLDSQFHGVPIKKIIETFHSRQLAEVGAIEAIAKYNDASALGNQGVFNQLAGRPRGWVETIGIVPSKALLTSGKASDKAKYLKFFLGSHMVVGYGTDAGSNTIKVYDPDSPNDPNAVLTITPDGGLTLNGSSSIPYGSGGDLGNPTDWLAVPIPDETWLPGTVEVAPAVQGVGINPTLSVIDNQHWFLDALGAVVFQLGTATLPVNMSPIPIMSGGTKAVVGPLAPNTSLSELVSTTALNATVGEFAASHVATTTETDAGAVGTTHGLDIDSAARSLHLYGASSTQQYTLQLGADVQANVGHQITLSGATLYPNATLDMQTDANVLGFSVSSSGPSQTIAATLAQLGSSPGSVNVQVTIPGGGASAAITVYDWTDLAHSLIYETSLVNGVETVAVLQDNPAQRRAAIDGLFQQLTTAISTISDPNLAMSLTLMVQKAQSLHQQGQDLAAAAALTGLEHRVAALSGTTIPIATATAVIELSQEIRGLL